MTTPLLPNPRDLAALLDGPDREVLERSLPDFVGRQRWFAAKTREVVSASFSDWGPLPGTASVLVSIVDLRYTGGDVERYHVPIALATGESARRILSEWPHAVLAHITGGETTILCDAMLDDDACRAMAAASGQDTECATRRGTLNGQPVGAQADAGSMRALDIKRLPPSHSNSVAILGRRYLLKLLRRLEPGVNQEVEFGRFFARGGHSGVPTLVSSLEHGEPGWAPTTLLVVQAFVPDSASAWDRLLEELAFFRDVPPPAQLPTLAGRSLAFCARLGESTARLHLALAHDHADAAFAPDLATKDEVQASVRQVRGQVMTAVDLLIAKRTDTQLLRSVREEDLHACRAVVLDRLELLGRAIRPFLRIRAHGDFHLGQVLVSNDTIVIIDFEGEPTRTISERRVKQSPLRDVAGMLRSLSYASSVAVADARVRNPIAASQLDTARSRWDAWAAKAYLESYEAVLSGHSLLPGEAEQRGAVLELYVLEKVAYEVLYEMNNRPDWVHIPLETLLAFSRDREPQGPPQ